MRTLPLILALCACGGHSKLCTSRCGLEVDPYTAPPGYCSRLQDAEDVTLRAFDRVATTDPRFAEACDAFRGWKITVIKGSYWETPTAGKVAGLTFCLLGTTQVNEWYPNTSSSSFAHEMAHVVQRCVPLPPYVGERESQEWYHSNWGAIYAAMAEEGL